MDGCMTKNKQKKTAQTSQRILEPSYNYDRKSNTESLKDYEAHRGECGVSAEGYTLEVSTTKNALNSHTQIV